MSAVSPESRRGRLAVPRRWIGGAARCLIGLLALGTVVPGPLWGHQSLVKAQPAADAELGTPPRFLRLEFREPLQAPFTRITLIGPDGLSVDLGPLRIEGDSALTAMVPVPGTLPAGRYRVDWRTTGADGHAVSGAYAFIVIAMVAPPPADSGQIEPPSAGGPGQAAARFTVESWPYILVRWANFLSLLGVLGAVAFQLMVIPSLRRSTGGPVTRLATMLSRELARIGRLAALGVLVAAGGRLVAQVSTMLDPGEPVTRGWLAALLTSTPWGWGWLLQLIGGGMAWWSFARIPRRRAGSHGALAAAGGLLLAVTPALSGHAIATPGRAGLAVPADFLHILAAGGWMGGLAMLLGVGLPVVRRLRPEFRATMVAQLVQGFSPPALVLGGVVALTGLGGALLHLERVADLWTTTYGQALSLKLGLVAVLFTLGAINFLRVRPALGTEAGTSRLRRSAGWELAVGIAVLLVTAVLVALPPAVIMNPGPSHDTAGVTPPSRTED